MSTEQTAQDLEAIDISITQAKESIDRSEALQRLEKSPDFQKIIGKGFLEEHAIRQVLLKAHPGLQSVEQQGIINDQICAIGNFKQYLVNVFTMGMQAKQALDADERTREEILAEDL